MPDSLDYPKLIAKSLSGDRVSLQKLLLSQYERLAEHIGRQIPAPMQSQLSPEDVIQQTVVRAVRHLGQCKAVNEVSFGAWLKTIAENCLIDEIRHAQSAKRGGGRARVRTPLCPDDSSIADIVELLSAGSHTPSRSAARHEEIAAVRDSIAALPSDYQRAVELRLFQGKSLDEAATILDRSPRAVQGLVDRAKKIMRADLERFSS